jgi:hexulose-6-phosphate isomerase
MELAKKCNFEGIELALSLDGELNMSTPESKLEQIRQMADQISIKINSIATGINWQYSLTSNREDLREKAKSVARKQIDFAASLGAEYVLVCPGTVGVDFKPSDVVPDADRIEFFCGSEVIDYDVAYNRSLATFKELAPYAELKKVTIGIENIWNKFLLSPLEMRRFIDEINSKWVGVYFDVGNVLRFGYPEQWIRILGSRIKILHFKDYRIDSSGLSGFVDLLAGDVNFVQVIRELQKINFSGWANAEMCPVYKNYSDQIVYNTSASMDRILGIDHQN